MNIFLVVYIKSEWCGCGMGKIEVYRGVGVCGILRGVEKVIKRQ